MSQVSVPWQPRSTPAYGLTARSIIGVARIVAGIVGPIVSRFAGFILIGAVVGVCVAVWVHALVFGYVDLHILGGTALPSGFEAQPFAYFSPSTWGLVPSVIGLRIVEAGGWAAGLSGLLQYLLWPVQFGFFRDLLGLGGLVGLFNVIPVYTIWWERKVAGRIQSRLGPMRVGGWHGWSQSMADGIKLILKEDLIPKDADALLFRAAPYFALIPVAIAFVALPFGDSYVFRELDVALVFLLGILGVEVIGVIMAGWASNNKWSVYGAMREACQMVSYEIPMGMALMASVVCVGSLSLGAISDDQSGGWFSWLAFRNPFMFGAFVTYFIASLASAKRAPFDLPEAESELVAGFHTEYSGIRWSFFFFAEYSAMFIIAALAAIMFLGGWHSPFPGAWGVRLVAWVEGFGGPVLGRGVQGLLFDGPIWLMFKAVFLLFVHIWVRWTLPRIRIDQVLYACVQVLLPLTMIILLGTTMWVWASTSESAAWSVFDGVVNAILGVVGLAFAFGFVGIASYGFYHRRKLVGNLVVDAMPGS